MIIDDEEYAKLVKSAQRWDALMSSERLHLVGHNGAWIKEGMVQDGQGHWKFTAASIARIKEGHNHLHMGMEFWNKYPGIDKVAFPDAFERSMLTAYVDHIIEESTPKKD